MGLIIAPLRGLPLFEIAAVVGVLLLAVCEVSFRFGARQAIERPVPETKIGATAAIAAGMVTLLAFVLGLTINFGQSRYDARRAQVAVEANTIGTAYLRARLVGGPDGDALADQIAAYARTRLAFTEARTEKAAAIQSARTGAQQERIWTLATRIARRSPTVISSQVVAALNDMIDASLSQRFAFDERVPELVFSLLLLFSILAVAATGFQLGLSGAREPVLSTLLILMWTAGMMVTVDLSRPRDGSIRASAHPLEWTIEGFTPSIPLETPSRSSP